MALLDRLRPQPAWKHSDPATRVSRARHAARSEQGVFATLAREDESPRVRRAAVARLDDIDALGAIARGDADDAGASRRARRAAGARARRQRRSRVGRRAARGAARRAAARADRAQRGARATIAQRGARARDANRARSAASRGTRCTRRCACAPSTRLNDPPSSKRWPRTPSTRTRVSPPSSGSATARRCDAGRHRAAREEQGRGAARPGHRAASASRATPKCGPRRRRGRGAARRSPKRSTRSRRRAIARGAAPSCSGWRTSGARSATRPTTARPDGTGNGARAQHLR